MFKDCFDKNSYSKKETYLLLIFSIVIGLGCAGYFRRWNGLDTLDWVLLSGFICCCLSYLYLFFSCTGNEIPCDFLHRLKLAELQNAPLDITDNESSLALDIASSFNAVIDKSILRQTRLRQLMEYSPVPIISHTMDGTISFMNQSFTDLFGYTLEDIPHIEVWYEKAYPDEDYRSTVMKVCEQQFQFAENGVGILPGVEVKVCTKDRSVIEIFMSASLQDNYLIGMCQDRTEINTVNRELDRLRIYLSSIIDSMPSVIIGINAECCITQWNSKAITETGISACDAMGRRVDELLPRLVDEVDNISDALRTKSILSRLKRKVDYANETRFEDITVYPLSDEGEEGAVIRIDDVTERAHIEHLMIQTEKMASVGSLAAGMAHEINNPLAIILAGLQNVLRRLSPELKKNVTIAEECGVTLEAVRAYLDQRKIIEFIDNGITAGNRTADIVKNMLQFSRRSDSVLEEVDLPGLIESSIELGYTDYDMTKQYDFKFVNIVREFDEMLPPVKCCANEIEQVLLNLFKNSLQAMEMSDMLEKDPKLIIRLIQEDYHIRLDVEDNGPGMSEDVRKRIFEPFFTTKAVGEGTGLGLSVSYMLITQNHSGTFEVSSEEGKGTIFTIRLPLDL